MEQRCQIILQNYLKTTNYTCSDYKIVNNKFINNYFGLYYKNHMLFFIYSSKLYVKYNNNNIKKRYNHNKYFYYYNNKNNKIYIEKNINLFKLIYIYNNKEWKYYNNFFNMYKKIIKFYALDICFMYYYSINKPYYIYI